MFLLIYLIGCIASYGRLNAIGYDIDQIAPGDYDNIFHVLRDMGDEKITVAFYASIGLSWLGYVVGAIAAYQAGELSVFSIRLSNWR